jgi:hypothetical protein
MVELALHLVLILPIADNVLLVYMSPLDVYGVITHTHLVHKILLALLLLVILFQMLTVLLFVKLLLLLMLLILDLLVNFLLIL